MGIEKKANNLEEIRRAIKEGPLAPIREILTDRMIYRACADCGHAFRKRMLDPVAVVFHYILHAVQRESSFAATCQEITVSAIAEFPGKAAINAASGAFTHARSRFKKEILFNLANDACEQAKALASSKWKGLRLLALDCSSVSMPGEKALLDHFGRLKVRDVEVKYPIGTAAFLLDVDASLIIDWRFGPFDPAEKRTAHPLLENLKKGDLLLADRGFSGAATLHLIMAKGADFFMKKHARLKVEDLPVVKRFSKNDFIAELRPSPQTRKNNPGLPDKVIVRLFKGCITTPSGKKKREWYVTSLFDADKFKRNTLARLYHRRWRIETSYLEFKQNFHADVLSSKTVDNEFAAHVLAYQLVRLVIYRAAQKHKMKPIRISFINASRWILAFSKKMSKSPACRLRSIYERMLDAVASSKIDVRPGRIEPRAITRERKHYPRLRIPRAEWRKKQCETAA